MSNSSSRRQRMHGGSGRMAGRAPEATRPAPARPRFRRELRLASVALAIFVVVNGALGLARPRSWLESLQSAPVRGVRLGMTMEQARAAFVDGAAGVWSSPPGCCGVSLEWSRAAMETTQTRWARFESHRGLVVAIRVLSDAPPPRTRQV